MRSGHDDSGGRHVVVCCAAGDRAALEPALDVLAARGLEVTVLEGVQPHTPALLEHVQRHGPCSIFVLAKSTSLHAPRLERMRTTLERAAVPPDRIVELDIDWRDPMALVEKVAAVPTSPAPRERTGPRPLLRTATPSPRAGSREPTGPRRTLSIAASPAPSTTATLPPAPMPAAARTKPAAQTLPPAPMPPATRTMPPTQTLPPTQPMPVMPAPTMPVMPAQPMPVMPAPTMPVMPAQPMPVVSAPTPSSPPRTRTRHSLRTLTGSLRPIVRATGGWLTRSRAHMVGAGAGAVALVTAAIVVLSLGNAEDAKAGTLTIVAMPASGSTVASEDDPAAAPDADAPKDQERDGEGEAGAATVASAAKAKASAKPTQTGEHAGIVYAPLHPPKRNFQGAVAQCEALAAKGPQRWRLPTLGELHTLASGHVVERGVYWSGTESDAFGKSALVWSEKRTRAAPIGKKWSGARAVCVRDSTPAE